MRKKSFLTLLLIGGITLMAAEASRAQVVVSVSSFHESLSSYGQWVPCGAYGECWVPAGVAAGWQPYTNGEWIYTDYGWTWVSYDPWGGDPYHYGTWTNIDSYGWAWVPGLVWAPAWVTWSYSDAYVGWAPIPPSLAFGYSGYAGAPVIVSQNYYVFVPTNRMVGVNVSTVRVPVARNATILPATRKVTNFAVQGGVVHNTALPVSHIEKVTHTTIQRASISQAKTQPMAMKTSPAGKGGKISVVAPASTRAASQPMKSESKPMRSEGHAQKPLASRPESQPMKSESKPMRSETSGQQPLAPKSTSHGKSMGHSMKSEGAPMKSESQPKERTTIRENPPPQQHHPAPEARPMSQPREHATAPPKTSPPPKAKAPEKKDEKPPKS